ncbi:MAG: peptidoglycan DD-metalloendopeptidase family protein [Ferruginibacter sp.]
MNTKLEAVLEKHRATFHQVVAFDAVLDSFLLLDFTAANTELSESLVADTEKFSAYINNILTTNNCRFGIGGYMEIREIYKRSALFSFAVNNLPSQLTTDTSPSITVEPRSLHFGIDIWGNVGTKIFAPLGGMIHSFANNNNFGDYGATIVLQHQLDTQVFYTLYGHLSLKDIEHLRVGRFITRGECIGHFGTAFENGNWPPHLHFQIIEDMERKEGDYPGVCKVSEKEKYQRNCPDADLILNMMALIKK